MIARMPVMTLARLLSGSALLLIAACSSSNDAATPDAASTATVRAVDCATVTPAASITTTSNAYTPNQSTIAVGGVIKWTLPAPHDVASTTAGLVVDFGATKCLQFTAAGTFAYHCSAHGFTGSVTVQ
jgi:plastocyanin